jgi:DNA primase
VRRGIERHGTGSPEAKQATLEELFPYLDAIRSEIRREESIRAAADLAGAEADAVLRDFARYRRRGSRSSAAIQESSRGREPSQSPTRTEPSYDLFLMLATVQSREHFAFVRKWLAPEDLEGEVARKVFVALEESYRRGEESLDLLLSRIEPASIAEMVRERIVRGEFDGAEDQAIRDAVMAIRRRALDRKRSAVEVALRRVSRNAGANEGEELELLAEKMHLDQELQKLKGDE